MIPQIGPLAPGIPGLQTPNDTAEDRGRSDVALDQRPLSPGTADTARAVDPPKPANAVEPIPAGLRRDLNPPDPQAPAGPPPAFEASILDRAREQAFIAPPTVERAEAEARPLARAEDAPPPPLKTGDASPYSVPPDAETRAETEVAVIRRIETPYDTATVDISR